jgi:hypothetical protein
LAEDSEEGGLAEIAKPAEEEEANGTSENSSSLAFHPGGSEEENDGSKTEEDNPPEHRTIDLEVALKDLPEMDEKAPDSNYHVAVHSHNWAPVIFHWVMIVIPTIIFIVIVLDLLMDANILHLGFSPPTNFFQ